MAYAAGALSQVSVSYNQAVLSSAVATGGTGPYTYQWYRSTTTGFTPGGGNIISGATSLSLTDTPLIPNTTYYYVVVATDTGNSNVTTNSSQLAVTTSAQTQSPNQFAQTYVVGQVDLQYNTNTVAVLVDVSQATPLFAGSAVKMVDSAGGVPKVVGCSANSDEVFGFINYDIKTVQFIAGSPAEISISGNYMYLYAFAAIARGAQVQLEVSSPGTVKTITGSSGADIVGYAYDKASAAGQLIRVAIKTPSFAKA